MYDVTHPQSPVQQCVQQAVKQSHFHYTLRMLRLGTPRKLCPEQTVHTCGACTKCSKIRAGAYTRKACRKDIPDEQGKTTTTVLVTEACRAGDELPETVKAMVNLVPMSAAAVSRAHGVSPTLRNS